MTDPTLPLVSIVTPSYNQGDFIRQTITSVLTQDYPNLEHWVIDGGSTDQTLAILQEYDADPRFHWLSEPDQGQADAVNKGWQRCQGTILGWLNSDDTYLAGAIAAQVQALIDHPEVGVVYGDALLTNEQDQEIGRYHTRPFDRVRFLHVSSIPQPTAFLRRELIQQYGGLDSKLHFALDFELFLRLMWKTEFLYTQNLVATYRFHHTSKTVAQYDLMLLETIATVAKICEQHSTELPGVKPKAISDWYWIGAMNTLEHRDYRKMFYYVLRALQAHPFRPRIIMFILKALDTLLSWNLTETLISWLDRRAIASAKQP